MKIFLLVFGRILEAIKMISLVISFEKKNSIISKAYVIINALLGIKDVLSAYNSGMVLGYGKAKACKRSVEYMKSV